MGLLSGNNDMAQTTEDYYIFQKLRWGEEGGIVNCSIPKLLLYLKEEEKWYCLDHWRHSTQVFEKLKQDSYYTS